MGIHEGECECGIECMDIGHGREMKNRKSNNHGSLIDCL